MKRLLALTTFLAFSLVGFSQGMAFGFKGGPSLGFQKWDQGAQRDALIAYHGIAFIESLAGQDEFAIFAQLGYHVRGGAVRTRRFTYLDPVTSTIRDFAGRTNRYEFNNVSLTLGGKQKFGKESFSYYYLFGIRGDFTINTNLNSYDELFSNPSTRLYFPSDDNVRRFNYGVTVGGGLEFGFGEFAAGIIEFTVNPDFSKQYRRFPINNVYNPYTMQTGTVPELQLANNTIELSLGVRLLRKVEYVE